MNEPAFPHLRDNCQCINETEMWPGLTIRDWFAGQALIGILGSRNGFLVDIGTDNAPELAYKVADGMLAERLKDIAERPLL